MFTRGKISLLPSFTMWRLFTVSLLMGNIEIPKPAVGYQTCCWMNYLIHTFVTQVSCVYIYAVRFSTGHFNILQCHQCLRNGLSKSGLGDRLAAPVRELTLTMRRLLSSKVQGRTDFWKSSKPCHVGTHLICPDEYCQMSIFTYFQVFLHPLLLTKFATSILRVKKSFVTFILYQLLQ